MRVFLALAVVFMFLYCSVASFGGETKHQKGYFKKNGTYVKPHLKTTPDEFKVNNLKHKTPKTPKLK